MDSSSSPSRIVKINVGGHLFMTTRDTLLQFPNSMLATMINGRWETDLDGAFFVDRSPRLFEYILEYLRTRHLPPIPVEIGVQVLAREARFYLLEEVAGLIEAKKYRPTPYELFSMLPAKNLSNMDLSGMSLRRLDLHDFDFTDSDLSEANLHEANLVHARLVNVNLSGADLTEAVMRGTILTGALLDGADLEGAKMNYSTEIKDVQMLNTANVKKIEGWNEINWV